MPSWLVELTKLLPSLAIPGTYSAGSFTGWTKKPSGQAKRAISEWLKPLPYDRAAVGAAVVELFGRIYTSPLLSLRAFGRSTLFTLFVAGIFAIGFVRDDFIQNLARQTSI